MSEMVPQPTQLRSIDDLAGPAGRLEALLNAGSSDSRYAALVCHPHPPSGGTMHNKVVYHAAKALSSLGLPVLRFNFRGVGRSEGIFDEGQGEIEDVRAALDWMERHLGRRILFAGFSFGSYVGLQACCNDSRVAGLVALGLPVRAAGRDYRYAFLEKCLQPKLFLTGDHDQFSPAEVMEEIFARAPAPKELVWIEGAEHFFQGIPESPGAKLGAMQLALQRWVSRNFLQGDHGPVGDGTAAEGV